MKTGPICSAIWIIALTALSLAAMGHTFAVGNHVIYLLWIERLRDPLFLANDWYLSTSVMHPNIVHPLRRLGDLIGDANAFLAALALSRLLLVAGTWNLARALGGSRFSAGLAAVLAVISPRVSLGGHYASGSFFDPSQMGMALSVLSLACLIERRHICAGLWLGATIHVHLFLGIHIALIEFLAIAFSLRQNGKPRSDLAQAFQSLTRIALPAAILGGWTLFHAAQEWLANQSPGVSGRDVVEILALRHPHHHSPLTWDALTSVLFILYIVCGLILARRAERWRQPVFRALFLYAAMAIMIGTVFVEWIPVELVALFQFFRVTTLLMIWTAVEVALWAGTKMSSPARIVLYALLLATFRIPFLFLPLALIAMLVDKHGTSAKSRDLRKPALALGIGAMVVGIGLFLAGAAGKLDPVLTKIGRPEHFRRVIASPSKEIQDAAEWVRANTDSRDVILAPPGWEGFSLYARRPTVVSFKQVTFTPPELHEWFERVTRVSLLGRMAPELSRDQWGNPEQVLSHLHQIRRLKLNPQSLMDEGYRLLSAEEVRELAEEFGATIFITNSEQTYPFERLHVAGGSTVYSLP